MPAVPPTKSIGNSTMLPTVSRLQNAAVSKPNGEIHTPSTVGNTFMHQYYHFLAKEPESLHRFYKDDSLWCHSIGSEIQEPISGQKAINDEILRRGYAGARVDLDIGSIDCQASLNGGVFVLVTGVMTLCGTSAPKPFVQTFFLAVQPKGYFVLNDCLRFLQLPGIQVSTEQSTVSAVTPVNNDTVKKVDAPSTSQPPVHDASSPSVPSPIKKTKMSSPKKKETEVKTLQPPTSPIKVKPNAPTIESPVKMTSESDLEIQQEDEKPMENEVPGVQMDFGSMEMEAGESAEQSHDQVEKPKQNTKQASQANATPPSAPTQQAEQSGPKSWAALFQVSQAASSFSSVSNSTQGTVETKSSTTTGTKASLNSPKKSMDTRNGNDTKENRPQQYSRHASLFIRDVPLQTKDDDLQELFAPYGSIASVNIPPGRGFAFVDYHETESMQAALAETKDFVVHGKVLQVDKRVDRKELNRGDSYQYSRGRGRGPKPRSAGDRSKNVNAVEGSTQVKGNGSTGSPRAGTRVDRKNSGRRGVKGEDGSRASGRGE